mgnify:FL=1
MNSKEFINRVYYFAEKIGVLKDIKSINLKLMKNKWASCSIKGDLVFNPEFFALDRKIIDYVIVHELLHLQIPNHGKLWKMLMTAYVKNWEEIEESLQMYKME